MGAHIKGNRALDSEFGLHHSLAEKRDWGSTLSARV